MNTKAIIGVNPELPYSIEEAMNRLRINVNFLGSDIRKIMIVSSEPSEGKSFDAMCLWQQMAASGERSILVDADLRKSVMVENYRISREDGKELWGTSHYLSDNKKLEDCILTTALPTADLLPNVNNVVNPSMLLEGSRFAGLLQVLSHTYRYVFLDVPPLGRADRKPLRRCPPGRPRRRDPPRYHPQLHRPARARRLPPPGHHPQPRGLRQRQIRQVLRPLRQ